MRYVNFVNEQTFHFFVFLSRTPLLVDELLARAFDAAAEDKDLDREGPTYVLWLHVAEALRRHLEELAFDAGFGEPLEKTGLYIGEDETEIACDGGAASLVTPILWNALEGIHCYAVAEAIMKDRGKWSPEKVLAEIDQDGGDGGSKVEV